MSVSTQRTPFDRSLPRFTILDGRRPRPRPTLRVHVQLSEGLDPSEGVALRFLGGERLRLLREGPRSFHGWLPDELRGARFRLVRTPDEVPESGYAGQVIPLRVGAGLRGQLRLFPVTWRDRPGRGGALGAWGQDDLELAGRRVRVRLPEASLFAEAGPFPLVLALDGQNLFDPASAYGGVDWALDRVTRELERDGTPACVLVGIDHAGVDRLHEYGCREDREEGRGGGADAHLDWILDQLVPALRERFPISDRPPALMGSSMGGHLALYAALTRPERFSGLAAMSPSIGWAEEALLRIRARTGPRPRVWMDMGEQETLVAGWQLRAMERGLRHHGWRPGRTLRSRLVPGAAHHESAWSARAGEALAFLLGA